jgi:hypothetical protein
MKPKNHTCKKSGCFGKPHLGGLCKAHYEEDESRRRLGEEALTALHHGVLDREVLSDPGLRDELERLRDYWYRICSVLQTQQGTHSMPLDEAKYATEWCIALAQEIIKAQREIASGKQISTSLEFTQQRLWGRLRNLDAGLRSNGTRRE